MSPPCSPESSYLATPEFLSLSMHCLSAIELPIHLFGAYCILFKTPQKMNPIKKTMLNLQFWVAITDLTTGALCTPYLILPAMGGFPLGLLAKLGISTAFQVYLNFALMGCLGASIVCFFETRFNSFQIYPFWKKYGRYLFHFFNYFTAITYPIPQFIWFIPNQPEALLSANQFLLCDTEVPESIYFLGGSTWYFVAAIFTFAGYGLFCTLFFFFSVRKHLWNTTVTSRNTQKLQFKLQYAMVIQTAIPVIIFLIPSFFITGVLNTDYHNQSLNNLAMLILCSHGVSSTIAMLLLHQPYRLALITLIPVYGSFYRARYGRSSVKPMFQST